MDSQGSQYKNVHLHCENFKTRRNLPYTGASRAMERLKISGISSELDLRQKMELHPKSIMWKVRTGEPVAEARAEAARQLLLTW
mmetsp:Transcript_7641/g.17089  ORF Transcript_7641/g.17089 Transcript_7641/m.17089 type:complete len:84 (+) Transcript_7641:88-339(+)